MQHGSTLNCEIIEWSGWMIYYWDHCHCVMLFNDKPQKYSPDDGWILDGGIDISPYFLRGCGVNVPFDKPGCKDFYYGPGCFDGHHPPMRVTLSMPKPLAEMWGLEYDNHT